ncbi:helix-hairpin-helix domain-containing protein [Desulfonatronospira sp.]|uniref:ComEA family DNA-binding protein n=1 Tax=Desulfonatronospira sp. TaxID=1962951 RepID=UPI0025B9251A|nr:helix-hairpin-helix domain-containing protein [Desulfonatronospira sp.]
MAKLTLKVVILFFALTLLLAPASSMAENLININTAEQKELQSLQGIGPALSERIVEHRERFPFENKEDIMQVSGIGESIYENIKDMIVVD